MRERDRDSDREVVRELESEIVNFISIMSFLLILIPVLFKEPTEQKPPASQPRL